MTKKEILDTMQKCLDEMRQAESEQEGCALKKEKEKDLEFGEVAELKVPELKHPDWLV